MRIVISRILMWVAIVAAVWYFAQQRRSTEPNPQQEEAMRDAARHYLEFRGRTGSEVPIPQGAREQDTGD
jgi:hypothetical protein